jgi:DNA repair photolyase
MLENYKKQIIFRFTIGSMNNQSLKFWEPGAPGLAERLHCLEMATERGFQTSVSCEPYLDASIISLVYLLLQYVTETIWIGKMNFVEQRVDTSNFTEEDNKFLGVLNHVSSTEYVKQIYQEFTTHPIYAPKIQWKESIKKIIIREGWE